MKTWSRHVDLFAKDFIIVPINERSVELYIHFYPNLLKFWQFFSFDGSILSKKLVAVKVVVLYLFIVCTSAKV